jgi:CRP-like cAMP-binding protein
VIAGAVRLKRAKDKPLDEPQVARGGSLIGETALIIETDRAATAIALEPSTLYRITRVVFLRMLESDVEAANALRATIARRIDAALDDLDVVLPRFEAQ